MKKLKNILMIAGLISVTTILTGLMVSLVALKENEVSNANSNVAVGLLIFSAVLIVLLSLSTMKCLLKPIWWKGFWHIVLNLVLISALITFIAGIFHDFNWIRHMASGDYTMLNEIPSLVKKIPTSPKFWYSLGLAEIIVVLFYHMLGEETRQKNKK